MIFNPKYFDKQKCLNSSTHYIYFLNNIVFDAEYSDKKEELYFTKENPEENKNENKNVNIKDKNNELNELLKSENRTISTDEKSKLKIFNINKNKKLGRKRKNTFNQNETKNDNKRQDNVISTIKRRLYKNIKEYIKQYINIKNINTSIINGYHKEDHINFLNLKIIDLLTGRLSKHYNIYDNDDYNKRQIQHAVKNNKINFIEIINKTFREILDIYRGNEINTFKGFKTLEDDKEIFKNKNEDISFIEKYEYFVKNFEHCIDKIKTRRRINNNITEQFEQ